MKTPAFLFGFKVKHGFSVSMAFGGCLPTSPIELILMGLLPLAYGVWILRMEKICFVWIITHDRIDFNLVTVACTFVLLFN